MILLSMLSCTHNLIAPGTATSNSDGEVNVVINIEKESSILLMAESQSLLVVKEIIGPDAETLLDWNDWKQADRNLSNSLILSSSDIAMNWPIRDEDPSLIKGEYQVRIGSYDKEGFPTANTEITATLSSKTDTDLNTGTIKAWIVTTESVTENVQSAIEEAVSGWKAIWSNYGLAIEIRYGTGFSDPLPLIFEGAKEIEELRENGEEKELLVVIGESFTDMPEVLGFSGNVPGSTLPSPRSAVVISWLANAGTDGEFDTDEIRLFSETIAHEAGHYLGLYHPVEIDYSKWDALQDTAECTNENDCHQELKNNVMFPYPVCSVTSCSEQNLLTNAQQSVLHHNTAVD